MLVATEAAGTIEAEPMSSKRKQLIVGPLNHRPLNPAAYEQMVRAARLAMFDKMLKDALDG